MGNAAAAATVRVARGFGSLPVMLSLKSAAKSTLLTAVFSKVDCFIASYPKSGRTWFRFMMADYLNEVCELGLAVDCHNTFPIIPNSTLHCRIGWGVYRSARDYDRGEESGLRVRRGKVGGFRDYLDAEDVAHVERTCAMQLTHEAKKLTARAGISLDARSALPAANGGTTNSAEGAPATLSTGVQRP